MALDYIEEANLSKVIIFSDSLSVLQSINNSKIDYTTCVMNKLFFVGYPAILVLEVTKRPTKQLSRHCRYSHRILKLPYTDFKPAINKYLLNKWQHVWNTAVDNKLHSLKSILGEWRPAFRADQKEKSCTC